MAPNAVIGSFRSPSIPSATIISGADQEYRRKAAGRSHHRRGDVVAMASGVVR